MNYSFQQLRIFLTVADNQSITKAADLLHITQPAVSIQLKKFQANFEEPLYEVIGRKVHLTDLGEEIAGACRSTMQEAAKIKHKASELRGEMTGTLKISVVSTAKYVMPYLLSDFMHEHQNVDLQMDVTNKSQVLKNLEDNEIDFAMVSTLPSNILIEKIQLMPNKLFLVGSADSPKIKSLTSKIGQQHTFIYREQGSATRQIMETFLKSKNVSVEKRMQLTSNEAVKQAVIAGLGYSIMPIIGIKNALQNESLQVLPIKGLPKITNWHLIWLKNKKFGKTQSAFLDYIRVEKEQLIARQFSWVDAYN